LWSKFAEDGGMMLHGKGGNKEQGTDGREYKETRR